MSDVDWKAYIREHPCPRCGYDGLGESVEGSWTHYRKEYERAKGVIERQRAVIEAARCLGKDDMAWENFQKALRALDHDGHLLTRDGDLCDCPDCERRRR